MKSEKQKAKNKNPKLKIFLVLMVCFAFCVLSFELACAYEYELLQRLPESGPEGKTQVTGLSDYLTWLYRFALGVVAFLAVLKIEDD